MDNYRHLPACKCSVSYGGKPRKEGQVYTVVVQFQTPWSKRQLNPESYGWRAVPEGDAFATLKGAITRRRIVADRYPTQNTAIQAPTGHLVMLTPAIDPDYVRPEIAEHLRRRAQKRKLVPRNPRYGE